MKTFTIKGKEFIPASHEDATLVCPDSHLQMVNWAKIPAGKHFNLIVMKIWMRFYNN